MTSTESPPPLKWESSGLKYIGPPKDPVDPDYQECLELGVFEDEAESYCLKAEVPDAEIAAWLNPKSNYRFAKYVEGKPPLKVLRLLIAALPSHKHGCAPFTEEVYRSAVCVFDLRHDFIRSEKLQGPIMWFKMPQHHESRGFVVRLDKLNQAIAAFTLGVTYREDSIVTCATLRVLIQAELNHVCLRLRSLAQYAWHPALLPLVLIETRIWDIPETLVKHKKEVQELERTAGVYKNPWFADTLNAGSFLPGNHRDFDTILGQLSPIQADCLYMSFKCRSAVDVLSFIEEIFSDYDELEKTEMLSCTSVIKVKIAHSVTWASNALSRCQYISDRADALNKTCYNLMAQRDNWLNLQMAELSRKDNLQMKEISIATKRDSNDMRAISVLTLIFLPATFVATFFSTSFFDFTPDGLVVSKMHWIYWVTTVGLTIAILLLWYVVVRSVDWFQKRQKDDDFEAHATFEPLIPEQKKYI